MVREPGERLPLSSFRRNNLKTNGTRVSLLSAAQVDMTVTEPYRADTAPLSLVRFFRCPGRIDSLTISLDNELSVHGETLRPELSA